MTRIEALELELAARKMVEGTELDWWSVIKRNASITYETPPLFRFPLIDYELALGIIEGKPVWKGGTYYHRTRECIANFRCNGMYYAECSWNPPKPKTEKLKELLSIQKSSCDCHNDNYFRGIYNGMEVMLACVEDRRAEFINKPKPKTVLVELPIDAAECYSKYDAMNILATACRKALEEIK